MKRKTQLCIMDETLTLTPVPNVFDIIFGNPADAGRLVLEHYDDAGNPAGVTAVPWGQEESIKMAMHLLEKLKPIAAKEDWSRQQFAISEKMFKKYCKTRSDEDQALCEDRFAACTESDADIHNLASAPTNAMYAADSANNIVGVATDEYLLALETAVHSAWMATDRLRAGTVYDRLSLHAACILRAKARRKQ